MNAIICLVEGTYWDGLTAIINSAIRNNFEGCVYVGYRGHLPNWLNQFKQDENRTNSYAITDKVSLQLILIISERNLGYEKPFFIHQLIQTEDYEQLFYFDVDCVAVADFGFYTNWCKNHIALCEDECFNTLHVNHPWRVYWRNILEMNDYSIHHLAHNYVNSGFIGLSKINFDIIETWKNLTLRLEDAGLNTTSFHKNPLLPIQGDQEILNMALMTKDQEHLSIIGKEGMGFAEPCYLMVHCTKPEKPWQKKFLWSFLKNGYPVSIKEKKFLDYLTSPINNMGKTKTLFKKIDIFMTKIISRIF
jgi:hypothetical protein